MSVEHPERSADEARAPGAAGKARAAQAGSGVPAGGAPRAGADPAQAVGGVSAGPTAQTSETTRRAVWRATPRLRALALVAVAAAGAAAITRDAGLLLLAAPALASLALARPSANPGGLAPALTVSATRCFEGEDIEINVVLDASVDEVTFTIAPAAGVSVRDSPIRQVVAGEPVAQGRWVVRPGRWGRRVLCSVTATCRRGGLWQAEATVRPAAVDVFPHPPPARTALLPPALLRRIGEHVSRAAGAGVEFSGIRDYTPGDRLRDVNWPVSSRRGRLQVNQRAAERAADLVVIVDAFSEVGAPGDTTLERAVRGGAGLASAYLRAGDRVGAVALGGMLRWLAPAPGPMHFFRIAELVFDIRYESVVSPDIGRVPRAAMPAGTLAVLFSPLLDERILTAVADLRARGVCLVVVDVLREEPSADPRWPLSGLALRLWRLDRRELRANLASLGVPVLDWQESGLDATFAPVKGRRLEGARR